MIVCAGEALIDLVPLAEPAGAHAFRAIVGGSPLNVAVALGRLGVSTAFWARSRPTRSATGSWRRSRRAASISR